jgi:hypothetical protein
MVREWTIGIKWIRILITWNKNKIKGCFNNNCNNKVKFGGLSFSKMKNTLWIQVFSLT